MLQEIIILIVLLALSALFSGLETAYISISFLKVRALKEQKKKGSKLLFKLKSNQRRVLITVLIGNNLVNVGASAYSAVVLSGMFGSKGVGIIAATVIMTLLILTFGEIIPKTYFARHAERIGLRFSGIVYIIQTIFLPLTIIFEKATSHITDEKEDSVTESEIKTIIEMGAENDILHEKQEELMQSVFEFDNTTAKEIMTPRVEVFALEENNKVKNILKQIKVLGFSRIPVYSQNIDKITGYVHIIDLLNAKETTKLKEIANKISHISSEKIIQELFIEMQKKRKHMSVIVDEFGGTAGIVTMEDIIEELVGEIYDEQDEKEFNIKKTSKNTYLVDGDTEVEEINEKINIKLKESENYSTIGGYLQKKFKDIPKVGKIYKTKKMKIEILSVSTKKIEKVRITLL